MISGSDTIEDEKTITIVLIRLQWITAVARAVGVKVYTFVDILTIISEAQDGEDASIIRLPYKK